MNSQQINYFMAVASNLSFTKTSEELFVSQPAVSRQISMLEKELGVRLFNRSNHRTELTDAGKLYYDFFSQAKAQLRNIQQKIGLLENGIREPVRLGILEGWDIDALLIPLLQQFDQKHPDAELSFNFFGLKEIRTMLLTGGIDLALTLRSRLLDAEEIQCLDVASPKKLLICSRNHPVVMQAEHTEELTPYDFRNVTFYAPWDSAEENIAKDIEGYLSPYGFTPHLQFVHNAASMLTAIHCGQGAGIINTWSYAAHDPSVFSLPMEVYDHICLAWMRESENQHTQKAVSVLSEIIRSEGK